MQNEEDNKHFNHLKTIYNNNLKTILKYSYDFIIKIFKKNYATTTHKISQIYIEHNI